jgi:alkylated DNA repair dioxygenase AlkB
MQLFSNDSKELENISLKDGAFGFSHAYFDLCEANTLFESLKNSIEWQQHHIKLFGKIHPAPRLSAWYGDEHAHYAYSGISLKPLPFTPTLQDLRIRLENELNIKLNSVLANLYRDGNDSMGWHADDENTLGANPKIVSINLGATRTFLLKHKFDKSLKFKLELFHGSLLFMHGSLQQNWLHCVPKTQKKVGERINLTFRHILH